MPSRIQPPLPHGPGDIKRIGQVLGSATGLLVEQLALGHQGPMLLVCRDTESASRISSEIGFYTEGQLPVQLFPDWETLPYDSFSPHQDIISTRIEVLYRLSDMTRGVLVVPAATLMQRLPPRGFVSGNASGWKPGSGWTRSRCVND